MKPERASAEFALRYPALARAATIVDDTPAHLRPLVGLFLLLSPPVIAELEQLADALSALVREATSS